MNSPRFNVFNQIHKAMRALLFDTVMQWQQTDMTNSEAAAPVACQVNLLLDIFDAHAHFEDNFIMHPAAHHAPELMADFEAEHETDLQLTNELRTKLGFYHEATDKLAAANEVYYALNDFAAFNLRHMNKEEQLLNRVLWQHYTDADILDMEREIQQRISPDKMPVYFEWMIKGINDTEMLLWLSAVKCEAPDFVLATLLGACAQYLPAERWTKLEHQLSEGVSIA